MLVTSNRTTKYVVIYDEHFFKFFKNIIHKLVFFIIKQIVAMYNEYFISELIPTKSNS